VRIRARVLLARSRVVQGRPIAGHESRWWREKVSANRKRDARKEAALREEGIRVLVVWQCEIFDEAMVTNRLCRFLSTPGKSWAAGRVAARRGHGSGLSHRCVTTCAAKAGERTSSMRRDDR
jgi:hypothetical protein